jgi:hypothetical protein
MSDVRTTRLGVTHFPQHIFCVSSDIRIHRELACCNDEFHDPWPSQIQTGFQATTNVKAVEI